jgi:hypothetical protein
MCINLAAPESRPSLPHQDASVCTTSPRAQHEPLTMRQNGKRLRDFDMDEGLQQRKRSRNDVSDLLLCSSTYLTTLSSSLQSRYCYHRLPDMLPSDSSDVGGPESLADESEPEHNIRSTSQHTRKKSVTFSLHNKSGAAPRPGRSRLGAWDEGFTGEYQEVPPGCSKQGALIPGTRHLLRSIKRLPGLL